MAMRFSIKWLLAGTAYAALAAAALGQPHWALSDLLWLANFLALAYALLIVVVARGDRQLRAAGFVTGCALILLTLEFSAEALPTNRIVTSFSGQSPGQPPGYAGSPWYPVPSSPQVIRYAPPTTTTAPQVATGPIVAPSVTSGAIVASPTYYYPTPVLPATDLTARYRAANTLSVMLAGLAGLLLAGLALRRCSRPSPGSDNSVD